MTHAAIDPDAFYTTDDPALLIIAKPATMRRWRYDGRGPRFIKKGTGRRAEVVYKGSDILAWLEAQRIDRPLDAV